MCLSCNWSKFDFGTTMASFWMKARNKWGGGSAKGGGGI